MPGTMNKWTWGASIIELSKAVLVAKYRILLPIFCALLVIAPISNAQQSRELRGNVLDAAGAPISGADVQFQSKGATSTARTDDQGNFVVPQANGAGTLVVQYPGFMPAAIQVASDTTENIQVKLAPAPAIQRIVVSARGEERVPAEPSSEFLIPDQAITVSGTLSVDEILRQAPGFSLFRRSGGLFANPTSQGASLRGVGASGASRAVVLLDGIPLNDPFGGWVYWNQVPRVSIGSMQVFSGGASDTYGGGALGGVINIETRPVRNTFGSLEAAYGNENTRDLSFDAGMLLGKWGISAAGQALDTDGYILVPSDQRGLVDTRAGTGDLVGFLQVSRQLGENGGFFLRARSFGEDRQNGTPVQTNSTRIPSLDLGADWTHATAGTFSARIYGSYEMFNQNFSAIAANRNSEALTNRQRSPSQQVGYAGQWQRIFGGKNTFSAGLEGRVVQGHSAETTFAAGRATAAVDAGGRQRILGYFAQDSFRFARNWSLTLGGRVDTWLNSRGYSNRLPLPTGAFTSTAFSNRTETAFSPRISLLHSFTSNIAANASVYRAFRAPTLNELYRNFRVGNVVTNANPGLRAEKLTGGEAGVSVREWNQHLTLRGNFFWSDIDDPVGNVTLSTTPALITRQRQNLGVVRARGVEISAEAQLPKHLQLSGSYILTDSTVLSFPANRALEGLRVPQVPKHSFNAQLSYVARNWTGGFQARLMGNQFDDDQNLLPLGRAFTADAEFSRRILEHAHVFVAVQNIFNNRYTVARTPITNVGPPAIARGGLRFDFP
jgi:outer membrane receptor protein involved in Fe transport